MPATLEIRDTPHRLCIYARGPRTYSRLLVALAIGLAAGYFFRHAAFSIPFLLFVVLFAFGLVNEVIACLRGTRVQLLVGNLDLISTGYAPGGYTPSTISRADIFRLEFREAAGGGETPELPQGLYVEYRGSGAWESARCVLPHIDKSQTDQAIEALYHRFPDTGTLASAPPYESDLISLNLNQP
jgi:hypothetical protein